MHAIIVRMHTMIGTMMPTARAVIGGPSWFFCGFWLCGDSEAGGIAVWAAVEGFNDGEAA
jgi:hypothetical protein